MSGRQDFTTPPTAPAKGQTLAINERPELSAIDVSQTSTLAAGSNQQTAIYAPSGSIYRVLSMELDAPSPGGTTGNHAFAVRPMDHTPNLYGDAPYTDRLAWVRMHWFSAANASHPPDGGAAVESVLNLRATENAPILVQYNNGTDADQLDTRTIKLVVEEMSY